MAAQPIFAATPNRSSGLLPPTLDISLTAPTNTTTVFTAGANGSAVDEIRAVGVGTTVAGVINVFVYDGTYHLVDQILVAAVTSSATTTAFKSVTTYRNLMLKNGDSIRIAGTVAGNQALINVAVTGGDF